MKNNLLIFAVAILLPVAAFAGHKKDSPQPQDTTDWLNAPTPDGSPTLKETSDWLGKTLVGYFRGTSDGTVNSYLDDVRIDNNCNFTYSERLIDKHYHDTKVTTFPLGAVTSVTTDADGSDGSVLVQTGQTASVHWTEDTIRNPNK